ncbi:MAG: glycosyltransferase family 9 protein [Candidatus Aminicenantes bacterium]|nr:MAG: glycosyltransferase family 9 protein [Candidatus Aminicenantes bacterium]
MKSILLFRLGGLGDMLVAFPSIYLVRKKLSPCSITLVCREEYGSILKETGIVDDLISEGDVNLAPLFAGSVRLDGTLVRWLEGFSIILGWMQKKSSMQITKSLLFQNRKGIRFFVFDPAYPGPISKFFFEKTAEFLKGDEPVNFNECSSLPFSLKQKQDGLGLLGRRALKQNKQILVVHPGSGNTEKCWPIHNFIRIITQLGQKRIRGALVTGMAEEKIEDVIEKAQLPEGWTWLRNPPLLKLAELLSSTDFYLGNDSGVTHLAAACGTNGVALFRKDLADKWRPYGRVSVLNGESISDIKFDSVWEAVANPG